MRDNDKEILKDSSLAIADGIVAAISPQLAIAWGLCKALFGSGMKLRESRVLEFVEIIKNNPSVFTEQILATESFQDGFVFMLEQYIRERNEKRRKVMRNVFLGFTTSADKNNFPLEKFSHTITQLSEMDISVLKDVDVLRQDLNYQIYGSEDKSVANIYNLIHLGLLLGDNAPRIGRMGSPFVKASDFGKEFIQYIKET